MDDWAYCRETLPKVSRTFALNIAVLKGSLHRSVLTAYLFCRIVDTIEDAACLHPKMKTSLLQEFARLLADPSNRAAALAGWVRDTAQVDGSPSDLDLLANTARVFRVFDSLPENHRDQIVPSVVRMAQGMAHFQGKFDAAGISTLADESELEE
ncbi:MAG: squalene/phytoene synthase family protein, partial [Nitrospinaceae bacterium]